MTDWALCPIFGQPPTDKLATVRPSAYAIIRRDDGAIAVVQTPGGTYLPGGGIEPGETVTAAVMREALEECRLTVVVEPWSARAVEHVHSAAEHTHFEKRSTFRTAVVAPPSFMPLEADHLLTWTTSAEALALLSPASHRWAVVEWAAGFTSAPQRDGPALIRDGSQ